jgi:hypothetical protein
MDTKKVLGFIVVAIIFAVGGYFIGKGGMNNQGANLYAGVDTKNLGDYFIMTDSDKSCTDKGGSVYGHGTDIYGNSVTICKMAIKAQAPNNIIPSSTVIKNSTGATTTTTSTTVKTQ